MPCRQFLVAGHVQGVFFRASTREQAQQLGITGYARNLPDGRVEVVACGTDTQLDALHGWLRRGPPQAVVEACTSTAVADQAFSSFGIR